MPANTAPSRALEGRVDAYWEHGGGPDGQRILPDGCIDIIFDLAAGSARVVGAMTRAAVVHVPAGKRLFGVRFLPGAAAPYLTAPASDLTDQRVPLDLVTASGTSALAERIANAANRREREALLEAYLLDQRSRVRPFDPRVRRAASLLSARHGAVPLEELALAVALGERQLERLFRAHVGIAPKHYARIARLQHSCRLLAHPLRPQSQLAALAGYADESHLLRDFRALAGASPSALRLEQPGAPHPARPPGN